MKKMNKKSLDEVIFQGRNKDYGAFVLRRDEGVYLAKAVFLGVASFVAIAVTPLVWSRLQEKPVPTQNTGDKHDLKPVDFQEIMLPPKKVAPAVQEEKPQIIETEKKKTFDATVPTPTRGAKQEKPAAKVKDYDEAIASTQTQAGVSTTHYTPTVIQNTSGTGSENTLVGTQNIVQPKVDHNTIMTAVDKEAEFPGGINLFRQNIASYLQEEDLYAEDGKLSTVISFVVERDGTITQLKANGNDKDFNKIALESIKKIKKKWTPAVYQGEKVRSYYSVPIVFMVE